MWVSKTFVNNRLTATVNWKRRLCCARMGQRLLKKTWPLFLPKLLWALLLKIGASVNAVSFISSSEDIAVSGAKIGLLEALQLSSQNTCSFSGSLVVTFVVSLDVHFALPPWSERRMPAVLPQAWTNNKHVQNTADTRSCCYNRTWKLAVLKRVATMLLLIWQPTLQLPAAV